MVSPEQMREEATVSGPGDVAAFSDGFFSFNLMRTKKKKKRIILHAVTRHSFQWIFICYRNGNHQ